MMLFTTTTQYVVLALVLVAGWLFGLATHPGGKKWKTRYEKERAAHNAYRTDADGRLRDSDRRVVDAEARVRALETDLTTERNRKPYVPDAERQPGRKPVYISEREARSPRTDPAPGEPRRGWFDFGR